VTCIRDNQQSLIWVVPKNKTLHITTAVGRRDEVSAYPCTNSTFLTRTTGRAIQLGKHITLCGSVINVLGQCSFHQLLHNHPHLSSGVCTIGQKWPQYERLGPTPPIKKIISKIWLSESILRSEQLPNYKIPIILRNPKVHYRIHNSPPRFPLLSQSNTVHPSPFLFLKCDTGVLLPQIGNPNHFCLRV
jgi:hypothetical protein